MNFDLSRFKDRRRLIIILSTGIIFVAAVFLSIGYLAGRERLLGQLRDSMKASQRSDHLNLPPGPPLNVSEAETYSELNAWLNNRLEKQYLEFSPWLEFLETTDDAEQQAILEKLRTDLTVRFQPRSSPETNLNPQKELWFSRDGVDAYLVEIETHPEVSLLSVLLIPQESPSPTPALLVLHGYNGNLQAIVSDIDYHHGFGFELAKQGFIVLAPLRVASTIETHSTLNIKSLASSENLETINIQQLVRAVDYLYSLDGIDKNHIGAYGISLGGQHALRLGALDRRLSLIISSGYFTDRFGWLFKRDTPTAQSAPGQEITDSINPLDHLLITPPMELLLDDLNLVTLIQPRFLGIVSGENDPRHDATLIEFEKVSGLFNHVAYPERAEFIGFNGGHETSVESVMPFITKWLETGEVD